MLFFLIFLWTPPHFWALALYRSGEYGKVNIPMMNEVKGPEHTLFQSKVYCVLLPLGLRAVFGRNPAFHSCGRSFPEG